MKIIKIGAMWCPSCLIMNDIYEKNINKEKNIFISYDYDMDYIEVEKYNISNILPVIIVLDNNDVEIARLVGEHTEDEVKEFFSKHNIM